MVRLTGVGQRLLQQQRAVPLGCPTAGDGTRAAAWEDGRDRTVVRGRWKKKGACGGNIWFSSETSVPGWCLNQNVKAKASLGSGSQCCPQADAEPGQLHAASLRFKTNSTQGTRAGPEHVILYQNTKPAPTSDPCLVPPGAMPSLFWDFIYKIPHLCSPTPLFAVFTARPICPHFKISFPPSFLTRSSSDVASPTHNTASFVPGLTRLACKGIKSSFEPAPRDITWQWNLKILTKSAASCFGSRFSCIADGGVSARTAYHHSSCVSWQAEGVQRAVC